MITLRPYQRDAVDACYSCLRNHADNPCIVIPTGGGKTPVIAKICEDAVTRWHGRVLVLAHVRELLAQSASTLSTMCPHIPVGIYSAGMGKKELCQPITVAGIQSIHRAMSIDAVNLIIIDEAHMIPTDGDGMYRTLLDRMRKENPKTRLIGLTATPYRMRGGMICGPENILNRICIDVSIPTLIENGFLSPVISRGSIHKVDTAKLNIARGEYVQDEVAALMNQHHIIRHACDEIIELTEERKSVLVFCCSISHCENVEQYLSAASKCRTESVTSNTPPIVRDSILTDFKDEKIKYLVNVNVLTTGFDAPNIDCVAMLRPTASPGLYYQMVGRGFRIHPGKKDCLVLDYGRNVERHGPIDRIVIKPPRKGALGCDAPGKECPKCMSLVHASIRICPVCGFAWPAPKPTHEARASSAGIVSTESEIYDAAVYDIRYDLHVKMSAPTGPKTMRVDYFLDDAPDKKVSEWICIEHTGYAQEKARAWWARRCMVPFPERSEEAVAVANENLLATTKKVRVKKIPGDSFPRILAYALGPVPEFSPVDTTGLIPADEEVPF